MSDQAAQSATAIPASSEAADGSSINKPASMRQRAIVGMVFAGLQSVAARVVLLLSQIILGYLLMPEAFGLSALAGTVTNVAWTFTSFGTNDVLLQRGRTMHLWERTVFWLSLGGGLFASAVLIVLGPILSNMFDAPILQTLLLLSVGGIICSSLATVPLVKLRYEMDFKILAGISVTSVVIMQVLIVIFALNGFGALSFFLPIPVAKGFELIMVWRRAPPDLRGPLSIKRMWLVINRSLRVFVCKICEAVLMQADYFVLGIFALSSVVGYYSFAYRLAAVPVRVLGTNLRSVLVPALTRLKSHPSRQAKAALNSAEMLAYLIMPFCFFLAAVAEPGMRLLFGEKWIESIILLQILSIGLPMEAILGVAKSQLAARAEFTRAMRIDLVCVVVFVVFTFVGTAMGKALGVAIAVSLYSWVVSPIIFFRVFPSEVGFLKGVSRVFIAPALLAFASSLLAYLADRYFLQGAAPIVSCVFIGAVCCVMYAGMMLLLKRQMTVDFIALVKGLKPGRSV